MESLLSMLDVRGSAVRLANKSLPRHFPVETLALYSRPWQQRHKGRWQIEHKKFS